MTRRTRKEAEDRMPEKIEKNTNEQSREECGLSRSNTRAEEAARDIRNQPQTNSIDVPNDEDIDDLSVKVEVAVAERYILAAIASVSERVDQLTNRVERILTTQIGVAETLWDELRKMRMASRKRHDGFSMAVEDMKGTLACIHDEFHDDTEEEEDEEEEQCDGGRRVNLREKLNALAEVVEDMHQRQGVETGIREDFGTWRVVEQEDRRAIERIVEKLGAKMGKMEGRMEGVGITGEKVDRVVELLERRRRGMGETGRELDG